MLRTSSVIIVGNEVLDGFTLDTNGHWLSGRLRGHGLPVIHREVVTDNVSAIVAALRRHDRRGRLTVLVGGIGPTPDDVTYEAVSEMSGRRLVLHRQAHDATANEHDVGRRKARQRMFRLPRGCVPLANDVGTALGCIVNLVKAQLVVLPGVPHEMRRMFDVHVLPQVAARSAIIVRELRSRQPEVHWSSDLERAMELHPRVRIGSYPNAKTGVVTLRVQGSGNDVQRAFSFLSDSENARTRLDSFKLRTFSSNAGVPMATRKGSKKKTTKRKAPKRKAARKTAKRKAPARKTTKKKAAKRKAPAKKKAAKRKAPAKKKAAKRKAPAKKKAVKRKATTAAKRKAPAKKKAAKRKAPAKKKAAKRKAPAKKKAAKRKAPAKKKAAKRKAPAKKKAAKRRGKK